MLRQFRIVHIHGALGEPAWLVSPSKRARPYEPNVTVNTIKTCADQIFLVTEEGWAT